MFLGPVCHNAPVYARYDKRTGELGLTCAACDEPVALVLVSPGAIQ